MNGTTFYEGGAGVLYANWNDSEPNNNSGDEGCIQLLFGDGRWNDAKCGDTNAYRCEVP